jgi:hypothetical protein
MPILVGVFSGEIAFATLEFWDLFDTDLPAPLRPGSYAPLVLSAILGVSLAYVVRQLARTYNKYYWLPRMKRWEAEAICRRCGTVFSPDLGLAKDGEAGRGNPDK